MNQEVKGNLARLLATEDLIVEHKNVDTASFNVHTRILTLPIWGKASNIVYDLLVGHEVGHALYTPDVDWQKDYNIPHDFVNIVEDVRIEKMMKRRYAGLNRTFYRGYQELHEMDFFQLKDQNISELNLADKVIVYSKIGGFFPISFNEEEREIVKLIENAETFEEVLEASKVLYDYCLVEKDSETPNNAEIEDSSDQKNGNDESDEKESSSDQGSSSEQEFQDNNSGFNSSDLEKHLEQEKEINSPKNTENNSSNQNKEKQQNVSQGESASDKGSTVKSKISECLNDSIKNLVEPNTSDSSYIEIPQLNLESIIVSYSDIMEACTRHFGFLKRNHPSNISTLNEIVNEYKEFKKSAQKEVNYLIKEFECKKSADAYARTSISRTGILDCTKLHTYKFNEDLFKKVATVRDGKNHGLIFILDWSGSMSNCIMDTVKQLYNLIWFCRKSSIPFEVYAFTNDWKDLDENYNLVARKSNHCESKVGEIYIDSSFNLMNYFSSKMTNQELEQQLTNIFVIASSIQDQSCWTQFCPSQMAMSGTPLNESIVTLHQIIPDFKSKNKLQKVHCVVLTDGDGFPVRVNDEYKSANGNTYIGVRYASLYGRSYYGYGKTYIRDRKLGTNYLLGEVHYEQTTNLIRHLRDKFPEVSFVGIRILSKDARQFLRQYYNEFSNNSEYTKLLYDWKKNRSFSIYNAGYHVYFGLSGSVLSADSDFEVDESASKVQIKSAFAKSLRSKKMNKKILSEFISLVA